MKKLKENSSKFIVLNTLFRRYILGECKTQKVHINKPKDVDMFLEAMQTLRNEKKKAPNLLFEEIEHDVEEKEKFVVEQIERIKEMNDNFLTLLDYE